MDGGIKNNMANFTIGVYDYTIIDTENNYVRVQVHPNYKDLTQYPDVETTVTYDDEEYTVTDMTDCFTLCRFLINAPKLSDEVTNLTRCFAGCDSLQNAPNIINVEKVETMEGCFINCKSLGSFSSFSLSHYPVLTNMDGCFMGCTSLSICRQAFPKTIINMRDCFYNCKKLNSIFSTFPASVEDIRGCFENCESLTRAPGLRASIKEMAGCFENCISLKGNLIIGSCNPEDIQFSNTYFSNIGELYLLGPSNNPELAEKWRQIASYYKRVHYEADDHPAPQIILKAIRTDNEKNPQTDGDHVLITKGYTISQDYLPSGWSAQATDEKIIQDNDETQSIYVPPGSLVDLDIFLIKEESHSYTYSLSDGYKTNEITINLPRALALLDFQGKSGEKYIDIPGMGMSIGKKAVRNGLDITFPTTIGKDLLPPTIWSLTSDITVDSNKTYYELVNDEYIEVESPSGNPHALNYYNATVNLENYQLVVGKYNKRNNDATFIIGNGSDDNNRSNLMEVGDIITLGSSDGTQSYIQLDYHSMQLIDKEGNVYFHVSDLRANHTAQERYGEGYYYVHTETHIVPSGYQKSFELIGEVWNNKCTVKVDGVETTAFSVQLNKIIFDNWLDEGKTVTVEYASQSPKFKAYTLGERNEIIGIYSVAEGYNIIASGEYTHAEGYSTKATGKYSHAEGIETKAIGEGSHAEGNKTEAGGIYSHAEGSVVYATGKYSHAEGYKTEASDNTAHAEGNSTKATAQNAHAEGASTHASVYNSHAEGSASKAAGGSSHAEGYYTYARGNSSHSEGYKTEARGDYSHTQNEETIAKYEAQTAIGKYNSNNQNNAFEIGNGSYDSATDMETRSNAFTVDWDGNVKAQGWAGFIQMYAGATEPEGWKFCNGQTLKKSDYPELFAAIETTYNDGTEASTDFRLPDLRGRTPIGVGQGAGLSNRTRGQKVGAENHTLEVTQIPSHSHTAHYYTAKRGTGSTNTRLGPYGYTTYPDNHVQVGLTGGGQAHNNMQPSLGVNFIICTGKTS